jgi:hypothetical protein
VSIKQHFQLVLIKPSHYDDDGYLIRWWRAIIPSNSLAAMYSIAGGLPERQVLGPDVDIAIEAIDETHTRVNVPRLLERFRGHGNFGLVGLVGVQSNQYPRALDIARPFRAAGIPVVIADFTCPAACRCSRAAPSISMRAGTWAFRCSPERPKAASNWCCGTPRPDASLRCIIS